MLYPGCECMTVDDAKEMENLNYKNGWGFTYVELGNLFVEHYKARNKNDIHTMEKIEYRLTDANFHSEASKLHDGSYMDLMCEVMENLDD